VPRGRVEHVAPERGGRRGTAPAAYAKDVPA
jgi:hypothetical protein